LTLSSGKIRSVQGYFDSRELPDQLGLQIVVQPKSVGPFTFGTAVAVQTGKETRPGAFSITELKATADDRAKVEEYSKQVAAEMGTMAGFIGWIGITIGERMMTVTAWTDTSDIERLRREGTHKEAIDAFMKGQVGDGGYTSVWTPSRISPQRVRCLSCRTMTVYEQAQGRCTCGAALPRPGPYW
jgi:heme-degrading monooxygenase HmoA